METNVLDAIQNYCFDHECSPANCFFCSNTGSCLFLKSDNFDGKPFDWDIEKIKERSYMEIEINTDKDTGRTTIIYDKGKKCERGVSFSSPELDALRTALQDKEPADSAAVALLKRLANDDLIGWHGRGDNKDWYYCEFCNEGSEDSTTIPHKSDCIYLDIVGLLGEMVAQPPCPSGRATHANSSPGTPDTPKLPSLNDMLLTYQFRKTIGSKEMMAAEHVYHKFCDFIKAIFGNFS